MKIAENFENIEEMKLSQEIVNNEYLQAFAQKMMNLSNRLNEVDEDNDPEMRDDYDIREDYLPSIREFIWNISHL